MKPELALEPRAFSLAAEGYLRSKALYRYACNPPIVTKGELGISAQFGRTSCP